MPTYGTSMTLSGRTRWMPRRVEIHTDLTRVEFELADNAAANTWFDYARDVVRYTTNSFYCTHVWNEAATRDEHTNWQQIKRLTRELEGHIQTLARHTGQDYSDVRAAIRSLESQPTQAACNTIHRLFTSVCQSGQLAEHNSADLERSVHAINGCVHEIEVSFAQPLREQWDGRVFQVLFTDALTREGVDFSVWNTSLRHQQFDHRTEDTDYDVWLNDDILGKDLPRCFLDQDDPCESDITGNQFLTPSLYFDLDRHYHRIVTSPEFNTWLDDTKCGKTLDRWPLGTITNITQLPEEYTQVLEYKFYD